MSRGGRGGGFGRGGGRGGGGGGQQSGVLQLVSFDFMKDIASGSLFNHNTALFPEMDVPIPRKPTSTEAHEWKLKKEYLKLMKESPYHLTPPPPPPDIERYSDRYKQEAIKRSLKEIETNLDFFPDELQTIIDPKRKKKKQTLSAADEYSQIEAALMNAEDKEGEDNEEDAENKEEEEGEGEEEYEDEEDLIGDNDYAETYFDNGENDDDDDGGDEDAY